MAINLPPIDIQSTDKQSKSNEISAIYENAIELTTNMSFMRGMITAAILAGFFAISFFLYRFYYYQSRKMTQAQSKTY